MFDKLEAVETRYEELTSSLGTATVQNDPAEYRKQAKMLADIEPLVEKYREYKAVASEMAHAEELAGAGDPEMRELAQEELADLSARQSRIVDELKILLIPKDPNDDKNVLVEIRAGTGGEEAALFAADLFRMYTRYAERQGWKLEVLSMSEAGQGGLKEVIVSITGRGAYSRLKYESGVHRVQRVPATEASGRIHTSTATVAVLQADGSTSNQRRTSDGALLLERPRQQDVNDLLGVRVTHLPRLPFAAGRKSQIKNRAKALKVCARGSATSKCRSSRTYRGTARQVGRAIARRSAPTTSRIDHRPSHQLTTHR